MAKSQVSFNKRENEKRRQKKKQDKLQRREERKAQAEQNKQFDDMIAYVDEFGNITDTPPNPLEKEKINVEDIEISVPKQEPIDPKDLIKSGVVTFYNKSKGYGFIKDSQSNDSFFFHVNGLLDEVEEHDRVNFETEMGARGPNAIRVKLQAKE